MTKLYFDIWIFVFILEKEWIDADCGDIPTFRNR